MIRKLDAPLSSQRLSFSIQNFLCPREVYPIYLRDGEESNPGHQDQSHGVKPADLDSVFNKVNEMFDWLPLAAVIDDRIVCLHGGIGSTLLSLDQIEQIQRPLEVIHEVSTPE